MAAPSEPQRRSGGRQLMPSAKNAPPLPCARFEPIDREKDYNCSVHRFLLFRESSLSDDVGGFGTVYMGMNLDSDELLAVKQDLRLVNWDCVLRTAISDIEVDYTDIKERTLLKVLGYDKPVEFGVLTSFAYPLEGGLGEIIVATTRVETMLGDSVVAVHPDDNRYRHLHGKFAIYPFNGIKFPIICDSVLVDPSFGTGAVKITPAHDPNDFEVGKCHNLEFINIFTDDGKINSNGGVEFEGMPRFTTREAVTEALQNKLC